jgi:predicted nucleotidyltransferase
LDLLDLRARQAQAARRDDESKPSAFHERRKPNFACYTAARMDVIAAASTSSGHAGADAVLFRMDEQRSMVENVSMITLDILRTEKRAAIVRLGEQHGASNIRVFGSVVRGENREESDVDFLVDFEKGRSLFDLIRFKLDLQDLLNVTVDVVTPGSLRYLRQRVLTEAQPL